MLRLATRTLIAAVMALAVNAEPAAANSKTFLRFGDVGALAVPLAAGIFSLHDEDMEGFWQLGMSYGAAMGTSLILKKTVNSTRPNGKPESFPSAHTASAFSGASYLHYRYGLKYAWPAYLISAAVGYSRVENDKHHWRDALAAAAISNLTAYLLTSKYDPPANYGVVIDPTSNTYAVSAHMRF